MSEIVVTGESPATLEPVEPFPPARRRGALRRMISEPAGLAGVVIVVIVVAAAVLAPWLTKYPPATTDVLNSLLPPGSPGHPLGTDGVGRDIWTELVYGARTSLIGATIAATVLLAIGVPLGMLAGYYRGRFDSVTSWFSDAVQALPAIVVLLVMLARVARSTWFAMAVFGFLLAPSAYRLIRSSVSATREELYIDAAKVSGLSESRIMRRHVFPVVAGATIIQAAQFLGVGIIAQAGIEFLGLGSSDQASWGGMLNDASQNMLIAPRLLIWPTCAIVLTVTALSLIGGALRDAMSTQATGSWHKKRGGSTSVQPSAPLAADVPSNQAELEALLTVDNLTVSYPAADGGESVVVDDVSLRVRRGEILGLVGESGSGKTQTAFAILGLLPGSARTRASRLVFGSADVLAMSPGERHRLRGARVAYVPQEPMSNLNPAERIGFQLTEPIRHHLGLGRKEAKAKALGLLERVGIHDPERVFNAYPHEVSGGMAQRVLIAGAVSCDPDLLIADEPTTALDVTVQAEVLDLLRDLQAERHMGVILVTHNFGVVADLCDTVSVMQLGRIVESGPVRQIFNEPQHDYTRLLLASTLESAIPRARRDRAAADGGSS